MVEQWPFKPFVTGSNPVRPIKNMFKKILFAIYFIPLFSFSQTVSINDEFGNKLNANYINNDSSKTIVVNDPFSAYLSLCAETTLLPILRRMALLAHRLPPPGQSWTDGVS